MWVWASRVERPPCFPCRADRALQPAAPAVQPDYVEHSAEDNVMECVEDSVVEDCPVEDHLVEDFPPSRTSPSRTAPWRGAR